MGKSCIPQALLNDSVLIYLKPTRYSLFDSHMCESVFGKNNKVGLNFLMRTGYNDMNIDHYHESEMLSLYLVIVLGKDLL